MSILLLSAKKLFLLSCHDSSLVPLLVAVGCYDKRWPPYSADLRFELYEDATGKHWVRALYCGKVCAFLKIYLLQSCLECKMLCHASEYEKKQWWSDDASFKKLVIGGDHLRKKLW